MKNKLKLGVFGFGCVGQGLYQVLNNTTGIKADIIKICVKSQDKERNASKELFTYDKFEILDNPEINVIVELINDSEDAFEIVKLAVQRGKAVVTANKKMIAENLDEIIELQNKYNVPILYEASSCASIPIIRNLEEYYDNDLLVKVEGIFNGSTNYILSQIFNKNLSLNTALKEAQKLGFAESDPTLDINGFDAKYKLLIILAHTFGLIIKPEELYSYGIQNLAESDIKYAKEKGYKIKLNAFCQKGENNKINAGVLPSFITNTNPLFNVENEYNGVLIQSIFSEQQFFVGKGAGSLPTGSAVLSDISALTYDYKYEYKKINQNLKLELDNDFVIKIYVRFNKTTKFDESLFLNIQEKYNNNEINYIIGDIKFSQLFENSLIENEDIFIAKFD